MRSDFQRKIPAADLEKIQSFQINPQVSIRDLAESIGVSVIEVSMPTSRKAYLSEESILDGGTGFVIYVNESCNNNEKRWAVAHELGHYFLHRGNRGSYFSEFNLASSGYDILEQREEWEANHFAEDIFLPKWRLKLLSKERPLDELKISKLLGIPRYRVSYRLEYYLKTSIE